MSTPKRSDLHPKILDRRTVNLIKIPEVTTVEFENAIRQRGLTQAQIGELLCLTRQLVSRVMRGEPSSMVEAKDGSLRVPGTFSIFLLALEFDVFEAKDGVLQQLPEVTPAQFEARRQATGVLLSQLEEVTDISRQRIGRIERGDPSSNAKGVNGEVIVPPPLVMTLMMIESKLLVQGEESDEA